MKLIIHFIELQVKILYPRVSKVFLSQQRLLTTAIKKARFLGLLPFTENAKHSQKVRSNLLRKGG